MCLEPAAAGVERAARDVLCPVLAPVRFLGSPPVAAQRLGTERVAPGIFQRSQVLRLGCLSLSDLQAAHVWC